jgi:predicted lactoylglutathione lyase
MAGIVFLQTNRLKEIREFYTNIIGAHLWLDQGDCIILKHDNFLFGFCQRKGEITKGWLLTFFYKSKTEVDQMYNKLKSRANTKPEINEKYDIYQFFAKDPDDNSLEFQFFMHDIDFNW